MIDYQNLELLKYKKQQIKKKKRPLKLPMFVNFYLNLILDYYILSKLENLSIY